MLDVEELNCKLS